MQKTWPAGVFGARSPYPIVVITVLAKKTLVVYDHLFGHLTSKSHELLVLLKIGLNLMPELTIWEIISVNCKNAVVLWGTP